jgi:hypothetical protein
MRMDSYTDQDTLQPQGGFTMSKVQCYVNDDEIMCYWQRRFWQAFRMLTLEQREILAEMPYAGEEP